METLLPRKERGEVFFKTLVLISSSLQQSDLDDFVKFDYYDGKELLGAKKEQKFKYEHFTNNVSKSMLASGLDHRLPPAIEHVKSSMHLYSYMNGDMIMNVPFTELKRDCCIPLTCLLP